MIRSRSGNAASGYRKIIYASVFATLWNEREPAAHMNLWNASDLRDGTTCTLVANGSVELTMRSRVEEIGAPLLWPE
jgi:hypothetical protein